MLFGKEMASGVRLFLRRQLSHDGIFCLVLKRAARCPSGVRVVRFYSVPYGEKGQLTLRMVARFTL